MQHRALVWTASGDDEALNPAHCCLGFGSVFPPVKKAIEVSIDPLGDRNDVILIAGGVDVAALPILTGDS
jgi:hypothetical protein